MEPRPSARHSLLPRYRRPPRHRRPRRPHPGSQRRSLDPTNRLTANHARNQLPSAHSELQGPVNLSSYAPTSTSEFRSCLPPLNVTAQERLVGDADGEPVLQHQCGTGAPAPDAEAAWGEMIIGSCAMKRHTARLRGDGHGILMAAHSELTDRTPSFLWGAANLNDSRARRGWLLIALCRFSAVVSGSDVPGGWR